MTTADDPRPDPPPIDDVAERAWLFAVGALAPDEEAAAREELARSPAFAAQVRAAEEELVLVGLSAEPVAPSTGARARLQAALADESPFAPLVSALARFVDLAEAHMRELVGALGDLARWEPGPGEGVQIFHLDGGPATAGAVVGFVRIPAGAVFPEHTHVGRERVLVMQGTLLDEDGSAARPGDVVEQPAGSTHFVRASDDEDVLLLVVVDGGVDVDGERIGPGDPRL